MRNVSRIRDLPANLRPRERLLECGPEALHDAELLAILLRTGLKGASALDVAHTILQQFGSLNQLSRASLDDLKSLRGVGPDKATALLSAFTLARRLSREIRHQQPILDTPEKVADLLREDNRSYKVETFQAVLVNARHRLIRVTIISQGTLDTILVHPREVFREAILAQAAGLILAHNHPSGDPTPSEADIKVTRDLIRAGDLLKIDVLDHVILGRATLESPRDFISLRELGYFYS